MNHLANQTCGIWRTEPAGTRKADARNRRKEQNKADRSFCLDRCGSILLQQQRALADDFAFAGWRSENVGDGEAAYYLGSTTGRKYDNDASCSPVQVSWNVDLSLIHI